MAKGSSIEVLRGNTEFHIHFNGYDMIQHSFSWDLSFVIHHSKLNTKHC